VSKISRDELYEWFLYDPVTGIFTWRKRPEIGGKSAKVGDVAGSVNNRTGRAPRRILSLNDNRIYASRAAYMMMAGGIPDKALIDHIDGNTLNDSFANLRLASGVQNTWNRIGLGSMPKGVSKDARGRFKARITGPESRKINLGTWETEAEAHAAYMGEASMSAHEFDPSFPDAMKDSEIRIWINACNHEPARQALRQLLAYRGRGVSKSMAEFQSEKPVAVKPLVWSPVETWKQCSRERAPAFGGEYQIVMLDPDRDALPSLYFEIGLGAFMFRFEQAQDPKGLPGETCPRKFPSIDAAKAAAQADYERRILSALDGPHSFRTASAA